MDDELDDWFIESLKTYSDLHVYQLERPTRVIEWTSGRTVCVAGCSSSRNEILELQLPLKLLASENKGLCAERDFKVVHGGFTDAPVCCLKHVPGTRCAVTTDGRSSRLQLWDLGGDDSDVIRRTGSVEGDSAGVCRIATRLSSPPDVLHGARGGGVRLSELTSGRTLYTLESDSAEPLSSLHFVSDSVFLAAAVDGKVFIADTRSPAAPELCPPPVSPGDAGGLWWTGAGAGRPGCRVVRVSAAGLAVTSDLRNPRGAARRAQLDVRTQRCTPDHVGVSWAPALDGCIAVSGFGGAVQIYDSSLWGAELAEARPLFEHRGHAVAPPPPPDDDDGGSGGVPVSVTAHAWHPERPRTLLSAASDGSVHVWDWVDQSAASS